MTIESADQSARRRNGKFPVSNAAVERTLAAALAEGCTKIDLFGMVGLPGQTESSALATVDYCRYLIRRFRADPRLAFYVAPLGPFLDPGSRAYGNPDALGYRRRFHSLAVHRSALLGPTAAANFGSVAGQDELKWRIRSGIRVTAALLAGLSAALAREVLHAWNRIAGRYDGRIATPIRLVPVSGAACPLTRDPVGLSTHGPATPGLAALIEVGSAA